MNTKKESKVKALDSPWVNAKHMQVHMRRARMCWGVVVALGCIIPEAGAKDWEARGCKAALKVAAEVATHGCAGFEAFVIGNETMIAGW